MNHFISLKLRDGGIVAVRPEAIQAVESIDEGVDVVRINGAAYAVLSGQFTLSKLINHTAHAGVRVID